MFLIPVSLQSRTQPNSATDGIRMRSSSSGLTTHLGLHSSITIWLPHGSAQRLGSNPPSTLEASLCLRPANMCSGQRGPHLNPSSFPLLQASQVIVDVADLTIQERQQILYNHLKHGRQDEQFLRRIAPHLEALACHDGFTPELARRLADPIFTAHLGQPTEAALREFFDSPRELLESILETLDTASIAALGLIFVGRGWLPSPIELDELGSELLIRLGASLGGVTEALLALDGSLVSLVVRDQSQGWVFAHPTMIDAYAKLLRNPEFLHLLIAGFTIDALLSQTTCGDLGIENTLAIPQHLWPLVMDRIREPLQSGTNGENVEEEIATLPVNAPWSSRFPFLDGIRTNLRSWPNQVWH